MKNKDKGTKKYIKKGNIPIIIAILLLIVMVIALVIVIFHKDDKGLVLPDAPKEKSLSVEKYDYQNSTSDPNDITANVAKDTKVEYKFITDYYKQGILLSYTMTDYIDNEFLIYSGPYSDTPFISAVDIKGNLKWINKIKSSGYDTLKIINVQKLDNSYYIFAVGTSKSSNDNVAIKINSKGKEEKREIISKNDKNRLSAVVKIDNGFAITTEGDNGLIIYTLSKELKQLNDKYKFEDENISDGNTPLIKSMSYQDKIVTMVVKCNGSQETTMYLVKYDIGKRTSTITPFNELMNVRNPYTGSVYNLNNNFLIGNDKYLYMYNDNGELIKKYDYSNLKLKEHSYVSEDGESVVNSIRINDVKIYGNNIIVESITNSEYVYDVFDENLTLKNRYALNLEEFDSYENVLLDVFFIDDKLYNIYTFGFETPSVMMSIIG